MFTIPVYYRKRRLFRLLHVLIHFMIFKRQRIIVQNLQIQGSAPRPMMRRSTRVRDWLRVAHPPQTQRRKWTRTKRLSRKRKKRKSKFNVIERQLHQKDYLGVYANLCPCLDHQSSSPFKFNMKESACLQGIFVVFWIIHCSLLASTVMYVTFLMVKSLIIISTLVHL